MTKQEFLAMSYPYEIKLVYRNDKSWPIIMAIGNLDEIFHTNKDYKPILRPLPDLTKPIEHKREKFVPIEKLREIIGGSWCSVYERAVEVIQEWDIDTLKDKIKYLPFEFIQLFISWHFDIADLISKEEAIDVNTLEENPYK